MRFSRRVWFAVLAVIVLVWGCSLLARSLVPPRPLGFRRVPARMGLLRNELGAVSGLAVELFPTADVLCRCVVDGDAKEPEPVCGCGLAR